MRRLDELHLQWPFLGSRMLRDMLRLDGIVVGRRHPRHLIYPYLLRKLVIDRGLDAAQASLRASQDNLRSGYGIFYPAADADVGATRERYTLANFGEQAQGTVFNLFTLSTTVSYALDIFGGQRRLVEGLRAEVEATLQLVKLQKEQVALGEVQAQGGDGQL